MPAFRSSRPVALLRRAALPCVLGLGACSGPMLPTAPPGNGRLTVQGQYEVIAACLVEVSEKSLIGAATLRVDRTAQAATLRRVQQPSNETQYELSLRQSGATTVQVEGRAVATTATAQQAYAFMWSQVEICARDKMAP